MVQNGQIVTIAYTLTNADGEELDRADPKEPFSYLHGAGQIVRGLESALAGLKVGDKKKVTVSPEEGYGTVDPALRFVLKKSEFPPNTSIEAGMQFVAEIEGEKVILSVLAVENDSVEVDGNHPLAGETLNFEVEILALRDATKEELAHGHSHSGACGHS